MSNAIFPIQPGLDWNASKSPMFNTKVMTSVNGRELRASFQAEPKYQIALAFAFLRQDSRAELDQIEGFFLARRGSWDSFLLAMPGDSELVNYQFAVGDGGTTIFQLKRKIGGYEMPLMHVAVDTQTVPDDSMYSSYTNPAMWSTDGALMWGQKTKLVQDAAVDLGMWHLAASRPMWSASSSDAMWFNPEEVTVNSNGQIVFDQPPGLRPLFFTGTYFYRCRFKEDSQQYTNFMHNLWEAKKVEMIGSLGNKV